MNGIENKMKMNEEMKMVDKEENNLKKKYCKYITREEIIKWFQVWGSTLKKTARYRYF